MMKVAIPYWKNRVSPVFDVAKNILLVEIVKGIKQTREEVVFEAENPQVRTNRLVEIGTDVLICGAISWPLEMAIMSAGIEVIPQICGEIDQILEAFTEGRLYQGMFLMPGCCRGRQRSRSRCRYGRR